MQKKGTRKWIAWMLTLVMLLPMLNTGMSVMNVQAEEYQEAATQQLEGISLAGDSATAPEEETPATVAAADNVERSGSQEDEDNSGESVFAACMLDKESYDAVKEGGFSWNVDESLWVGADTIEGIFNEVASNENLSSYPYLAITTTKTPQKQPEGMVSIPRTLNDETIEGVAICAWDDNPPLKVEGFQADTELYLTGCIDSDVKIAYSENAGVEYIGTDVILKDLSVSGKVYTEDTTEEQLYCSLFIRENVTVGGLKGFRTVYLWSDFTATGAVEFYTVNTAGRARNVRVEDYSRENIPVFHEPVAFEDWAYEYTTALIDRTKYPVYEIPREGYSEFYVQAEDIFYWVEPHNNEAVYGEISDFTMVTDEALLKELAEVSYDSEKYLVYEYPVFRYSDENGEYEYVLKDGNLYQITSNGDMEGKEEDKALADTIDARVAADQGDSYESVAGHYEYGGKVRTANVVVNYVEPLEEGSWEWEHIPLTYGTQVIAYDYGEDITRLDDLRNAFSFWTGNAQGDDDTAKCSDWLLVGLDGKVYNGERACFDLGAVSDSLSYADFPDVYRYPNWENVVLGMKVGESKAYHLRVNRNYDNGEGLETITMPQEVETLIVTADWKDEETPNYVQISKIEIQEHQNVILDNLFAGSSEENDEEALELSVEGNGVLTLRNSKINQNIAAQDTITVEFAWENCIKGLTGAGTIDFRWASPLAVEDVFDASESKVIGGIKMAARYDADIIFGAVDATDASFVALDKDGKEVPGAAEAWIVSEYKNGQSADIRFTSNDLKAGYSGDSFKDEDDKCYIIYNSFDENGNCSQYLCKDNQWYELNDDALEAVSQPENLQDNLSMGKIEIRMLDGAKESVFTTNSLYGAESCFWTYNPPESDMYDYRKDYCNPDNFVDYTTEEEIQAATILADVLPSQVEEREAFLSHFMNSYFNTDDDVVVYECLGAFESATQDPENKTLYGLTVSEDKGNETRYVMFTWGDNGPVVDTNKYLTVYKATDLSGAQIASIPDQTYTGSAVTPSVVVTLNGQTLTLGRDYEVSYSNHTQAGTATVTIKGVGIYTGSKSAQFTIVKAAHVHTPSDWIVDKEATENQEGLKVQKCTECGEVLKSETIPKKQGASDGTTTNPPAAPHTHTPGEWTVKQDATASTTGLKEQRCTECGEVLASETIPVYTVKLNVKKAALQVKQSTTAIQAEVMEGDKVAKWESSNKAVATVTNKGKITGKKAGKATITVTTSKGAKAKVVITVQKNAVKVTKVKADVKKLTLKVKESYLLKVTKTPVTAQDAITYSSSNKKVATVDKKGKIVAKKAGTATITIKCGSEKTTVKVTVKKK